MINKNVSVCNVTGSTHDFMQVGNDIVFTVGRDGKTCYNPVHGITLHIPDNSLPDGIEQIKITIKVGFSDHDLGSDMVICSATVALQCVPQVVFIKDVFLEIPYSASLLDTSNLCFIKFKDDNHQAEVYNGIFPIDHPYGVIMINSFSSFVIVKGKKLFYSQAYLRKSHLPQHDKRQFCKPLSREQSKQYGIAKFKGCADQSNSNLVWFGLVSRNLVPIMKIIAPFHLWWHSIRLLDFM